MRKNLKVEIFIATARKYLGYQSEIMGENMFGRYVGYDLSPWSGAFIDVVARECGLKLPAFTYVPSGLMEFIRSNGVYRKPRPGDIAVFAFPSVTSNKGPAGGSFEMPSAGIVVDVREFKRTGRFVTVEGNTTGESKHQQRDGVHQRIRHSTDVILFCRPAEFQSSAAWFAARLLTKLGRKLAGLHPDPIEINGLQELTKETVPVKLPALKTGTRNRSIEVVQLALSRVTDIKGAERGKWDAATASAFAAYKRSIGMVAVNNQGEVDRASLERLAADTGLFKVAV